MPPPASPPLRVLAALGCTLGILPHVAASVAGLAALLHTSALAFEAVRYLGVAYLFWMAWGVLRDKCALQVPGRGGSEHRSRHHRRTFAVGL